MLTCSRISAIGSWPPVRVASLSRGRRGGAQAALGVGELAAQELVLALEARELLLELGALRDQRLVLEDVGLRGASGSKPGAWSA